MSLNVQVITSSIFQENGVSSQLSQSAVNAVHDRFPDAVIHQRDLIASGIPHFGLDTIQSIGENEAALADALIEELQAADLLVLAVPMYNFSVPSQFKAWMDHVARAGTTFKYTETGPVGLLEDKKVIVITSRGGLHHGKSTDSQSPLLKTFLGFLGLHDVSFVYAEALNMGEEQREENITKAKTQIRQLIESIDEKHEAKKPSEVAI